jgi:hypothetical protein
MARFSQFKKATPWAAPKLAAATAEQGRLDAEYEARDNEIRAQNQQGLAKGYQHFTKDMETDPIADALRAGRDKVMGYGDGVSTAESLGAGGENIGTMGEYALGETTGANAGIAAEAGSTADGLAALDLATGGEALSGAAGLGESAAGLEAALAAGELAGVGSTAGTAAGITASAAPAAAAGAGAGAAAGGSAAAAAPFLASNPVGWGITAAGLIAALYGASRR